METFSYWIPLVLGNSDNPRIRPALVHKIVSDVGLKCPMSGVGYRRDNFQCNCDGRWEGCVCGSWKKGSHLGSRGARPANRGKRLAVGFGQWRRRDIARWQKTRETGSPHLQETFMHRVSATVHCIAVIRYNHNRNHVSLYYLFQENKSLGTNCRLHSSSDVREVVSSTVIPK
jgi:hypothetical protein